MSKSFRFSVEQLELCYDRKALSADSQKEKQAEAKERTIEWITHPYLELRKYYFPMMLKMNTRKSAHHVID